MEKLFVNGRYINTKLGKVHYSKTGTHVVPYIKKEMKKMRIARSYGHKVNVVLNDDNKLLEM